MYIWFITLCNLVSSHNQLVRMLLELKFDNKQQKTTITTATAISYLPIHTDNPLGDT